MKTSLILIAALAFTPIAALADTSQDCSDISNATNDLNNANNQLNDMANELSSASNDLSSAQSSIDQINDDNHEIEKYQREIPGNTDAGMKARDQDRLNGKLQNLARYQDISVYQRQANEAQERLNRLQERQSDLQGRAQDAQTIITNANNDLSAQGGTCN